VKLIRLRAAGAAAVAIIVGEFPLTAPPQELADRVLKEIGTPAVYCGRFKAELPMKTNPNTEQTRALRRCLTDAYRQHKAFYFVREGSVIDSYTADGLMGDSRGRIRQYLYDSAPCGGPGCAPIFKSHSCPAVSEGASVDPNMSCWQEKE
jgi:hypothetical protein